MKEHIIMGTAASPLLKAGGSGNKVKEESEEKYYIKNLSSFKGLQSKECFGEIIFIVFKLEPMLFS